MISPDVDTRRFRARGMIVEHRIRVVGSFRRLGPSKLNAGIFNSWPIKHSTDNGKHPSPTDVAQNFPRRSIPEIKEEAQHEKMLQKKSGGQKCSTHRAWTNSISNQSDTTSTARAFHWWFYNSPTSGRINSAQFLVTCHLRANFIKAAADMSTVQDCIARIKRIRFAARELSDKKKSRKKNSGRIIVLLSRDFGARPGDQRRAHRGRTSRPNLRRISNNRASRARCGA